MVDISELTPGMQVRIIDEWLPDSICGQNPAGRMDHYLGKVVTVKEILGSHRFIIEEDDRSGSLCWIWNKYCVDYIVEDDAGPYEAASDQDIALLFRPGGEIA